MVAASQLPEFKPWLICRSESYFCALPLGSVVETMRPLPVELISPAPPFVSGMSIIRGQPLPVVDLGLFLGDPGGVRTRFVSITVSNRKVALAVNAVRGIHRFTPAMESALPPLLTDVARDVVSAVGTLDRELLFFFETTRMVPPEVFEHLGKSEAHHVAS